MLNVTDEQKMMFWDDKYFHNYVFRFPDTTLSFDNEQLHSEEITVMESICDEEDLKLGGCIASSIEFVVSEIMAEQIAGLSFTAEIEVIDRGGHAVQVVPMGSFTVDVAEQEGDKGYKKVVAYDYMYEMSVDVSEWYNGFFADGATHTVKETREALLEHLGASYIVQTLPNDDVILEKTIEPNGNLTGTELLRSICEINGAFGRMNREGLFEEITLHGFGLFPEDALTEEENLYPEETLYPEDAFEYLGQSEEFTTCPQWRSATYEEYMTHPITCLNIRSTEEDIGVTVGQDLTNPYVINSNILLYGKSASELQTIGSNILLQIKGLSYRPNTTELDGLPYMECGDVFVLEKRNDSIESYIFSRTLKGIQALIDTFEAKGNKVRTNEVTANEEIMQLKGKTLAIKKDIDGIRTEVSDLGKNTYSRFEQTASAITAEVQRATAAEGNLSSRIIQNAEEITAEVSRATATEGNLSSRITQTAEEITAEVQRATTAEGNLSSRITLTSESITAEVSRATTAEGNLQSQITVNASGISQKVTKGDICSEINQSSDTIELKSNRLVIESTNFSLDNSGNAKFSGELSGATGTFGGNLSASTAYFNGLFSYNSSIQMDGLNGNIYADQLTAREQLYLYAGALDFNNSGINIAYTSVGNVDISKCTGYNSEYLELITRGYADDHYTSKSSDARIKHNIRSMQDITELFMSLTPREFEYSTYDSGLCYGLVAQEIEEACQMNGLTEPMNVVRSRKPNEDEIPYIADGQFKYVNWDDINAMSVYMVQKHQKEIEHLRNIVFIMQGEIALLKQSM